LLTRLLQPLDDQTTHSITLIEVLKCGVKEIPEIEDPGKFKFTELRDALEGAQVLYIMSKAYFIIIIYII